MPNFKYRAKDKFGKTISGVFSGDDKSTVAKHLGTMGYSPISIEEAKKVGKFLGRLADIFKKVSPEDRAMFTRQLLTMQQAGVTLLASLYTLEKQTSNPCFKDLIKEISASVEHGASLSEALAKYPAVFSELYVNMVKAGEASGLLEEMLKRLAEFEEKEIDTAAKIRAAVRYPMLTLVALACAFVVMVNFVVPRFASIFSQFNKALPLPTRILLAISYIMTHYWFLLIALLVGSIYGFLRYIHTKDGKLKWDSFCLGVPVFGKLISMLIMSRFARTMGVLIRSGLPILQVLDMVARTVDNAKISRAVDAIAINVKEGKGISEPMNTTGLFPPMVVQMVAVGEETGKVDELLTKVSDYYDQQSDYMMRNLATLIEPIFIVILGAMVLLMALAIFLPMWNLISVFKS